VTAATARPAPGPRDSQDPLGTARRLLAFCDASPSPFHACATAATALNEAGFTRLAEDAAWAPAPSAKPGKYYIVRGGTLVAWSLPPGRRAHDGFRIVGAHTDSPNLRLKPLPDTDTAGYDRLAVEAYGGVLLASWMDRSLGLSGRVALRRSNGASSPRGNGGAAAVKLLRVDRPLCTIPQLAIHLNRDVNQKGLVVDAQHHLVPIWGLDGRAGRERGDFQAFVAAELGVGRDDVLGWDLMLHDLTPGSLVGRDQELLGASRLDNLASCWAAVEALVEVTRTQGAAASQTAPMICLFDHEEVGSVSDRGAGSSLLPDLLERIVSTSAAGGDGDALARALARSACLSADMAHATHPSYLDRHDLGHPVALNGGPVLKVNANVRYATDAPGSALVHLAAEQADVPIQTFAMRSDLPCGSTIGPVTAARLGVTTIDVGMAQLAMHAAREHAGSHDPAMYRALMAAFLNPA
jgi:aspartyl aminopeptidase